MKTATNLFFASLLTCIASLAFAQTYLVTQTEFGDPQFADKDIAVDSLVRRDPEELKELIARERSTRSATYKLFVGRMKNGSRGLYYDHPPSFDRTGRPGKRVMILNGVECIVTRTTGADLCPLNRSIYLGSSMACLLLFSTWEGQTITIGESGILSNVSNTGVSRTMIWNRKDSGLQFKEFIGADVIHKVSTVANTSLDRKSGEWTFYAFGRKIRRFEFRTVDSNPIELPQDVIPFGTKIFDLRENGSGGVVARWTGEWPKNLPQVEAKENSQAAASLGWMALQGVAAVLGVGLLIAGGRQLVRRD